MRSQSASLHLDDYNRYGRQMILNGIAFQVCERQLRLQNAFVVVIGAGGLGCPALPSSRFFPSGKLGIVDHDVVELSNLQRQILHTEARLINFRNQVTAITTALTASNALSLLSDYDLILDCTQSPHALPSLRHRHALRPPAHQRRRATARRPDVHGPCFRCLFPKAPAPELAGSCEELGVLGAVTGVIGNLQIITGLYDGKPTMLIIRLRSRRPTCPTYGNEREKVDTIEETGYVMF
ncbi:uncharacterized protein LAESUDRAFT_732780, partial [Laetiporus sulphureus 93-53]